MSRLIKRGTLANSGTRAISYDVPDPALNKAPEDLAQARITGEMKYLEELKAQAYKEAMEKAETDINARLEKKIDELKEKFSVENEKIRKEHKSKIDSLLELATTIEAQGKEHIANLEPLVLTLTMHVLRKLTGKKEVYADLVRNIIAHAINELESEEEITVRLSWQDKEYFSADEKPAEGQIGNIMFDESLPSGGCIIQSGHTTIDASLSNVLNNVQSALVSELKQG